MQTDLENQGNVGASTDGNTFQESRSDGELIHYVRQCYPLWDMNSKEYKNVKAKEACWKQIEAKIKRPAEECVKRWSNLRDSYRREKRKRKGDFKSGNGKPSRKGFAYFNEMQFLETCSKDKTTYSNLSLPARVPVPVELARSVNNFVNPQFTFVNPTRTSEASQSTNETTKSTLPELYFMNGNTQQSNSVPSDEILSGSKTIEDNRSISSNLEMNIESDIPLINSEIRKASPMIREDTHLITVLETSDHNMIEKVNRDQFPNANMHESISVNTASCSSSTSATVPPRNFTKVSTDQLDMFSTPEINRFQSNTILSPWIKSTRNMINDNLPKLANACYSKDFTRKKKEDPFEKAFIKLTDSLQKQMQQDDSGNKENVENNLHPKNLFGNMVAAELKKMDDETRRQKKKLITDIIYSC